MGEEGRRLRYAFADFSRMCPVTTSRRGTVGLVQSLSYRGSRGGCTLGLVSRLLILPPLRMSSSAGR